MPDRTAAIGSNPGRGALRHGVRAAHGHSQAVDSGCRNEGRPLQPGRVVRRPRRAPSCAAVLPEFGFQKIRSCSS
jgi:hypothetical protein